MDIVYDTIMELRASRGYVKDYALLGRMGTTEQKPKDVHYDILLEMFRNDPVMTTAFDITVESVTNNGYKFVGDNDRLIKSAQDMFDTKFDFDRVIDNIIYSMLIYGDAFLEIRREDNGKATELHPMETTEMDIEYDEHGEIIAYWQKPTGTSKDKGVVFTPDNMIHFRLKWIGSRVYSYNPNESVNESYITKVYAYRYLRCIFEHLPPKMIHFLKNVSEEQEREFDDNLRRAKTNPRSDLVVRTPTPDSDYKFERFEVEFGNGLPQILDHLRQEVLMVTRVPYFWIGRAEGGNRSEGEALIYPFEIRIRKLQNIIASDINKKLLPKLNLQNLEFKFNPISFSSEKSVMEIANIMKGLGLEADGEGQEHPVVYYLKQKGIQIPSYTKIPSAEEMSERMMSQNPETATGQSETAPSRQRMNKKTDKMTSRLDEKGVSAEGKEKMDERINR